MSACDGSGSFQWRILHLPRLPPSRHVHLIRILHVLQGTSLSLISSQENLIG